MEYRFRDLKNTRQSFRYLWQTAGSAKLLILGKILVRALLSLSGVAYALLLRELVDGAAAGSRDRFIFAALFFVLVALGQLGLTALLRLLNDLTHTNLCNRFKHRLLSVLLDRDLGAVAAQHSAQWLNKLTSDTTIVADQLGAIFSDFFGMVVQLGAAMGALLVLEPRLGWLVLPAGAVLLLFSALFRRKMKSLNKQILEADGDLRQELQETLSGMTVVRAYAGEALALRRADLKMQQHKDIQMRRNHFAILCRFGFGLLMNGAYVLGALFCGHGLLIGTMGLGNLVAVMQLVGQVQSPLANVSGLLPQYYALMASTERLLEAEQLPSASGEQALSQEETLGFYQENFSGIRLEGVEFAYPGAEAPTLSHFDLQLEKQEFLAFTGPSGCGKSTVFRLLLGLYHPQGGQCRILGRDGKDYDLGQLRRLFAYVPQGNYFMTGPIRQVVAFACPDRAGEEEALWQALDRACAADFVRKLPQGLDTVLGEGGLGLSEGQLQRLSIARALFSERPVLLLDEATSALDEETEALLLRNLRAQTGRTLLIVTHRPAALSICSRVIRFETREESHGKI